MGPQVAALLLAALATGDEVSGDRREWQPAALDYLRQRVEGGS